MPPSLFPAAALLLAAALAPCSSLDAPAVRLDMNAGHPSMVQDTLPVVTQQDWDRYTNEEAEAPSVFVSSLKVTMIGKMMQTINERPIYAFQGIRYGTAARFKYSEDPGQYWGNDTEIFTNHLGDKCPQKSMLGQFGSGSEDCLFLNVYTPMLPDEKNSVSLPVMMFIHGGSFTSGDASLYMPTRLLDGDVILVVIQYRLGAHGWFSLQNDNAPGNAGLSDQILSLEWIQNHIESFGGDKDHVTIFGQSAGSASVSMLQTIGNITAGLFSGMLSESGSALEYWAVDRDPIWSAEMLGTMCNCTVVNHDELYNCLDAVSSEELAMCTHDMVLHQRMNGYMGFEGCAPVVQSLDMEKTLPLITKMPTEYIEAGEANNVPVMMGANRDEGSYVFGVMYSAYLFPNGLVNDSDYLSNQAIPDILHAFGIEDQTNSFTQIFKKQFFPGVDMGDFDAATPGFIDLTGVLFLKAGTYQTAMLHSRIYDTQTFFYSFDFLSNDTIFNWMFTESDDIPFDAGVTHGDELMYLFSLPSGLTAKQLHTKDRLVKLWTNFAIYGNPTPDEDESYKDLGIPKWTPLDYVGMNYLLIQDDVTVEQDYTERWTIEMDLAIEGEQTTTTVIGTPSTSTPTTTPAGNTHSPGEYEDIQGERDDFMITMIVFIIAFVVSTCAAGYFYFKSR